MKQAAASRSRRKDTNGRRTAQSSHMQVGGHPGTEQDNITYRGNVGSNYVTRNQMMKDVSELMQNFSFNNERTRTSAFQA